MKKAHFVGICGVGMSAVAMLLKEKGYEITGTDPGCYPPVSDYLKEKNIPVYSDYSPENVPSDAEIVIAGGSAKVSPEGNPEVKEANEHGIPVKTFPEVLGEISKGKQNILAIGSYGKSTVASITAWVLKHAGVDPSYFIGAIPFGFESPARMGRGDLFVMEGDEYPTSSLDKRAKFLHIDPTHVILVSAEHDHVNMFPTLEDYLAPFKELLNKVPEDGKIVACIDNQNVRDLIEAHNDKVITYGLREKTSARWSAKDIKYSDLTSFTLYKSGEKVIDLKTKLLGLHNIQNIVGVAALLLEEELVTPEEFRDSIEEFEGVKRRLDKISKDSSVLVFEGFGSSYDKARSAIEAMEAHYPGKRLVVVFEPHSINWRRQDTIHWYKGVFTGADKVLIYKPPHKDGDTNYLSHKEIVEKSSEGNIDVEPITSEEEGLSSLENLLEKDDVVLLLTSGNLGGLVQSIPELVNRKFPRKS